MNKLKLTIWDWLVGISIALNAGARLITNIVTSTIGNYAQTANVLEANPAARTTLQYTQLWQFFVFVIQVSLLLVFYLYLRRKKDRGRVREYEAFAILLFIFMLFDFVNDLGIFLGLVING